MTPGPSTAAPLLVFGWGNPSRGDDALGPLFAEQLSAQLGERLGERFAGRLEVLTDFQLQVEHALDLVGREQVLFVDASQSCQAPFEVTILEPMRDCSFTTHAMSPGSVLQVYCQLHGGLPPPSTLLAIRGERFGLGDPPSDSALQNLAQALVWGRNWLDSLASGKASASLACTN
jgi:hydrogenase maturation protease